MSAIVDIRGVTKDYPLGKTVVQALRGIDLTIDQGEFTAIAGPSGSGKTTLAHLLLGLFEPTSGSLLLDGVAVTNQELPAWQANCAFVPQSIRLIDASIRDNVAFGLDADQIDDDLVWSALEAAQFDEFVAGMTYGLYTMIGENGIRLSGGEKQRLSIARAFLKNSKIILLDEATSSLDSETEKKIQDALNYLTKGKTTLVIAHRLSTILNSHKIYVIDNGEVIGEGNHEELLKSSEAYKNFYDKQIQKH